MARSNRAKLTEKAKAGIRVPRPERLGLSEPPAGYRAIGVSLYAPEVAWVDRVTSLLKAAKLMKGNRSFVIQQAIQDVQKQLKDKTDQEIVQFYRGKLLEKLEGQ